MTAAVRLIDAASVAAVTGIMVEQTGESGGSERDERWEKGEETDTRLKMGITCKAGAKPLKE